MPKTLLGRVSILLLVISIIQICVLVFSIQALRGFIDLALYTIVLSIFFGLIGSLIESNKRKTIPLINLFINSVGACFFIYIILSWWNSG